MPRAKFTPGSLAARTTIRGSMVDRALQMLEPLGELTQKQFSRHMVNLFDTKDQALSVATELQYRGYIEKTVRITPLALTRKRTTS